MTLGITSCDTLAQARILCEKYFACSARQYASCILVWQFMTEKIEIMNYEKLYQ